LPAFLEDNCCERFINIVRHLRFNTNLEKLS
jgi:hypothetical protein